MGISVTSRWSCHCDRPQPTVLLHTCVFVRVIPFTRNVLRLDLDLELSSSSRSDLSPAYINFSENSSPNESFTLFLYSVLTIFLRDSQAHYWPSVIIV